MSTTPQGWQTPKTNWQAADIVHPSDFNRIEGNMQAIESGSRTLDPSQAPSGNTGSLRQLLDWLANRVKAITGKPNWYDAPDTTLAAVKTRIDDLESNTAHLMETMSTQYPRVIKVGARYPDQHPNSPIIPGAFTVLDNKAWALFIQPIGYNEGSLFSGQFFGEVGETGHRQSDRYELDIAPFDTWVIDTSTSLGKIHSYEVNPEDPDLVIELESDYELKLTAGSNGWSGTVYIVGDVIPFRLRDIRYLTYKQGGNTIKKFDFMIGPGTYTDLDAVIKVPKLRDPLEVYVPPYLYMLLEIDQSVA